MKKFFVHELKKSLFPIGVMAFIATAIYVVSCLAQVHTYVVRPNIGTIAFIGGALALLVPIWVFAYRMNKRSVDLYYSLPLKRVEILAVKYLIGLIAVLAPFTIAFWIGALTTYIKVMHDNPHGMSAIYYIPYYFTVLAGLLGVYSISSFAFTRANRTIDGILFILFWVFALELIMSVAHEFLGEYCLHCGQRGYHLGYETERYVYSGHYSPFSPLDTATRWFEDKLCSTAYYHPRTIYSRNEQINMGVGFAVTGLLAVGANIWLFLGEKKMRAENVGQVSESPFGYLVMIPLYTVCLIGIANSVLLTVLIIIGGYALSAVYRHTLKIGVRQGIILGAASVVGIAVMIIYMTCVK